jgi:Flp pilus assembly protein TadD
MTRSARVAIKHLFLCLGLFFVVNLHGQDSAKSAPDYSKEAFVIQRILNKMQFENDGTFALESAIQVRVQSAAGVQGWGLIQVPYASNEGDAAISNVKVTKPDGTVVSTPLDNIQDTPAPITVQAPFYSDLKIKQLAVKGLDVGDILEFGQSVHIRNPLIPGQFWFERNFFKNGIVLDEQLEIRVPRDRYVKVQSPKVVPKTADENGYRVYLWKASNLERPSEDEKSKAAESPKDIVPDVQITSFHSWEEVGQWYQQLEASRIAPTPEIKAKADELTRGATSENEKIRLLYNYVATKFRYIGIAFGIGRYQPHAAADVLANGYGDCKDKHTLLAALLNAAGIHSSAVLINSSRKLDPEVPSPGQFDHMITAVPQGKDLLWLDSTEEVAPAGYLVPVLRDKQALAVPDAGAGQLVRTPADPPFASSFIFKIDGKIGSDSALGAKIDSSFRGDVEYAFRAAFRSVSQAQWKDVAEAIAHAWSFSGTVSDVEVGSPEATDTPFSFKYTYQRKDYPNWPDVLRPPLPPINVHKLADDDKSSDPIKLESPGEYLLEANVELPKDMLAKTHAAVDLSKDFAEYHANYSWQSGVLHVQRRLTIRMREVPRARSDEYRAFWKVVNDDEDVVLPVSSSAPVSSERSSGSSVESPDARANGMLDLGDSLFRQGEYDAAIAQFRKALSLRPDDVRAHRTLGDVLWNKNDLDGAVTEYREALRLNPNDGPAHRSLGNLLLNKNDFDGANTEYREVLRLNPEDGEVHRSLGDVLLSKKDESGAIEQYHQALRIDPNDANAHRSLGDLLFFKGDFSGAIPEYREVSRLTPNDPAAHDSLGEALIYKQDLDGATAEYQAALRLKADDRRAHTGLGEISLRRGHAEQAIEELRKATAAGGEVPGHAYELLGGAYVSLRRYDEAIEAWKQAEKLLPWDPREPVAIASLLMLWGRSQRAAVCLK